MNTRPADRPAARIPRWADAFPYVNGGLFSSSMEVPRLSRIARSYLLHIGKLDWKKINPDIFGSMIQAVADDDERSVLGMHYTSVPNILKVLNPLFLDDLRKMLEAAGYNSRKLLHLRNRMSRIRVFDPACGSGNFLVIAYKEMRKIEAEINDRRRESGRQSTIPLTNFRGIELRDFPAEIARLALIIAEYQCDLLYRGQREALAEFLPLDAGNWITCGNALKLDWLTVCPPTGAGVKMYGDDLFSTPLDQPEIDFDNEGGETYICGNPPYLGQSRQNAIQKQEVASILGKYPTSSGAIDYVSGWLVKAAEYNNVCPAPYAFVTTNSLWQGQQIATIWPIIRQLGGAIFFAYRSIKWTNLATHNAGVIVSIVGIDHTKRKDRWIFDVANSRECRARRATAINAYLIAGDDIIVSARSTVHAQLSQMLYGNQPRDGGHLCLTVDETGEVRAKHPSAIRWIRGYVGSFEMIRGLKRYCIWIPEGERDQALAQGFISERVTKVAEFRAKSKAPSTRCFAGKPYRFVQIQGVAQTSSIAISKVSSQRREYIPATIYDPDTILSDLLFGVYDAPLWNLAFISSRLHLVWVATVCGKLKTDYRYSNTLGWNTFPVPPLTQKNRVDLTRCAEGILLAREAHFPATIADLYDANNMPKDLRAAHDHNDEVLERIYIGRCFKNDTERLETLFKMYSRNGYHRAVS